MSLQYVTVTEAAKILKCGPSRVYHLLREGRIEGVSKHGTTWLVPVPICIQASVRSFDVIKFGKKAIEK